MNNRQDAKFTRKIGMVTLLNDNAVELAGKAAITAKAKVRKEAKAAKGN